MTGLAAALRVRPRRLLLPLFVTLLTSGCSQSDAAAPAAPVGTLPAADIQLIDRLTWGVNASEIARFRSLGRQGWIDYQLRADSGLNLPPEAKAQFDAMAIVARPMGEIVVEAEALRFAGTHGEDKARRRESYGRFATKMKGYQNETVERSILRDLYSADQLREHMTWFWFNHFNVRIGNQPLSALVQDYEELTVRPRALGKFCDLVNATLRHPAMLIYLNNANSQAGEINENYARELMELHTMGVGSGYTQDDVKALARVLTGATVDLKNWPAPPAPRGGARNGVFLFDPARHDNGTKILLGKRIDAKADAGIDEATNLLCRQPATARRITTKLARFLVADEPPVALVDKMTETFVATDGDVTAVLRTMIAAPEFAASAGTLFKDPNHYLLSAIRLAFDGRIITRPRAAASMLATMGESRFGRLTPDGYPLDAAAWSASGQMATRFELAAAIGRGGARLFVETPGVRPETSPPPLKAILASTGIHADLAPATRTALDGARSEGEWNTLFLSSPEFMRR